VPGLLKNTGDFAEKRRGEDFVFPSLGESRMGKKILLCGLLAFAGIAGAAHGQPDVGTTVAAEPVGPVDCKPRPRFPLLYSITHNLFTPIRGGAGPLLPPQPVEATPTKEDIARMVADGSRAPAEILAAKIKMDEAQAKPRQAAVRYLATVDCHYYPEAETGLIAALRADRCESVRYEAAQAMATCRGTTSAMLEALQVASMGAETDGNPAETSERVRTAARNALNRALSSNMNMYPYAPPPQMAMMECYPPEYGFLPVAYPMPIYPLAVQPVQPVSPEEIATAATVGLAPRPQTPPIITSATNPNNSRSLIEWIQKLNAARESAPGQTSARKVDPRLRGLAPLGAEATLAIPAAPANPVQANPMPYNDE
jgi:hypothetical protein